MSKARLERDGAYFQTTSDSEIIVQLIAHSKAGYAGGLPSPTRWRQVEGAFSIVMMTRNRIFAARDPRGFRPLSMGRIRNPDGPGHDCVCLGDLCVRPAARRSMSAMWSRASW